MLGTKQRAKPGAKGEGSFYRVVVRPKEDFVTFRYQAVGRHIERLAGRRPSGAWADQAWLIDKGDAHIRNGRLVGDTAAARKVLDTVGPAKRVRGDIFEGHPRRKIPESEKPTPAQKRARSASIKKAQTAKRPW